MGLICFKSSGVAIGFVTVVDVYAAGNHVVGKCIVTLPFDSHVGIGVDASDLIAKVKDGYTGPDSSVANLLISLVESAAAASTWHALELGQCKD